MLMLRKYIHAYAKTTSGAPTEANIFGKDIALAADGVEHAVGDLISIEGVGEVVVTTIDSHAGARGREYWKMYKYAVAPVRRTGIEVARPAGL